MSERYRTANICNTHFSYNLRASKEPKMNRAEAVRTEEAREAESNGIDYGVICLREARLKQGSSVLEPARAQTHRSDERPCQMGNNC